MTAEATPTTVTVELNVETAYKQLVAHEKAYKAYVEADGAEAELEATTEGLRAAIDLINEIIPQELADQLHERVAREHPELKAPESEFDLAALMQMLMADD